MYIFKSNDFLRKNYDTNDDTVYANDAKNSQIFKDLVKDLIPPNGQTKKNFKKSSNSLKMDILKKSYWNFYRNLGTILFFFYCNTSVNIGIVR